MNHSVLRFDVLTVKVLEEHLSIDGNQCHVGLIFSGYRVWKRKIHLYLHLRRGNICQSPIELDVSTFLVIRLLKLYCENRELSAIDIYHAVVNVAKHLVIFVPLTSNQVWLGRFRLKYSPLLVVGLYQILVFSLVIWEQHHRSKLNHNPPIGIYIRDLRLWWWVAILKVHGLC